jgi:hypothetical protein
MGKSEADLGVELAEAKEELRGNPGDDKAKKRLAKAKDAVVKARQERRGSGVSIGGDAVVSNGKEG